MDSAATTLKLEGKLLEPWVGELQAACGRAGAQSQCYVLDLSQVSFVDAAGSAALCDLKRRGVRIVGCSPLVTQLIESVGSAF